MAFVANSIHEKLMTSLQIHFSGDLTPNHQIPMRTLGKSLSSLQTAIDRAYLDTKYEGGIWKHARMKNEDYLETKFLLQMSEEGGYILKAFPEFLSSGKKIINRVCAALMPAYEESMREGRLEGTKFDEQIIARKSQLQNSAVTNTYENLLNNPSAQIIRAYGDRAIAKEIDQLIAPLRAKYSGESFIDLTMTGDTTVNFKFDSINSQKFHIITSRRSVGESTIYRVKVVELDNKNLKGKVYNVISKKEANIYFLTMDDLLKLYPYLEKKEEEVQFVGAPIIEYGTTDLLAGDIQFLDLLPTSEIEL